MKFNVGDIIILNDKIIDFYTNRYRLNDNDVKHLNDFFIINEISITGIIHIVSLDNNITFDVYESNIELSENYMRKEKIKKLLL